MNLLYWIWLSINIFGTVDSGKTQVISENLCRIPNGRRYPNNVYKAFTCGQCFFFTFLGSSKQLKLRYTIEPCDAGTLICDDQLLHQKYTTLFSNFDAKSVQTRSVRRSNQSIIRSIRKSLFKVPTFDEWFWDECSCSSKKYVFNIDKYASDFGVKSIDSLKMEPALPNGYSQTTEACCQAAWNCCENMQKISDQIADDHCPMTWDGWQCWNSSKPGTVNRGVCPHYTYGHAMSSTPDPTEYYSKKECTSSAMWWRVNVSDRNSEWTDYRQCTTSLLHDQMVKHIVALVAFAISVIATIPAVVIFSVYRSLRVGRITVHKHLLISFLLNGIFYLFNNLFFVTDTEFGDSLFETNHISCRLAFLLQLRYMRTTNYMWMLCEGLYLYRQLIHAFSESSSLIVYYFIGWVFPIVPTILYAALRLYIDDEKCWIVSNNLWIEWVTYAPCILSLFVNSILMISILRILITKLRHSPQDEPPQYRKAVRATLVLLPVFGLHFCVTIYKIENVLWYDVLNKILDGLQGLIVAVIICYTHGDVIRLVKKTWHSRRDKRMCEQEARLRTKKVYSTDQTDTALL